MENKKPMSEDKKDLIARIIWLIAGVIFIASGAIMTTLTKGNQIAWIVGGSIVIACGVALVIISAVKLIQRGKKSKQKAH